MHALRSNVGSVRNKTLVGGMGDDRAKWLPLVGLLISLGILPKKVKPAVAALAIVWWLSR